MSNYHKNKTLLISVFLLYNITMKSRPLTEELIDELCEWVATDTPFQYCAQGCGVLYETFNGWLSRGEQDLRDEVESIYSTLYFRIKKTYAQVVRDSVSKIKSGDRSWTGEAWIRQRRDNEFMDKQQINSGDEKVIVQLGNLKGKHLKGVDK